MNRPALFLAAALFAATPLLAVDVDPKLDRAMREALPVCGETKLTWQDLPFKILPRFTGAMVKVESPIPSCAVQLPGVLSPTGGFLVGMPWLIADEEGATVEQKLKNFAWRNLQENVTVTIDRKANEDGLWPATMAITTEAGPMPMHGSVDPDGRYFFFGTFHRLNASIPSQRMAALDKSASAAPSRGPAQATVTVFEFSDFECPSCRHASGYLEPILAKHPDKVRYVRYDVPLEMHPWAFPAALAGRAVFRQKPGLFWEYKKAVYDNQENLSAFLFWDWARAWAQDHDLDLTKYDADLASAEVRKQILDGAGLALSTDVRATPTYMVNGVIVEPGADGKSLAAYVDKLLE